MSEGGRAVAWLAPVLLLLTWARAAHVPNVYARVHWMYSWAHGWSARGLPGTLARPILGGDPDEVLVRLTVISLAIQAALLAATWMFLRSRSGWVVPLVFATSPFVVMTAHASGYFDPIVAGLTLVAVVLGRVRWLVAAAAGFAAVLVHEEFLLFGLPVVAWVWCLGPGGRFDWRSAAVVAAPLVAAGLLVLAPAPDSAAILDDVRAAMTFQEERAFNLAGLVEPARHAFGAAIRETVGLWRQAPSSGLGRDLLVYGPSLGFLLVAFARARIAVGTGMVAALAPLGLNLFGNDRCRFETFPIFTAALVVGVAAPVLSRRMTALGVLVVALNLLAEVPLFGDARTWGWPYAGTWAERMESHGPAGCQNWRR